jgi:ATPase subunit of ABC transporter with duplicated ATPase domains
MSCDVMCLCPRVFSFFHRGPHSQGRGGAIRVFYLFLPSHPAHGCLSSLTRGPVGFRCGQGKSTLLRAFASRRVGEIPENVTVHYVSQEVNLTPSQRLKTPVEIVVEADLERTLLMDELATLDERASAGELDSDGSKRHGEVLSRLDEIGAVSAPRRAESLLETLGFSKEFLQRPLSELSGGW